MTTQSSGYKTPKAFTYVNKVKFMNHSRNITSEVLFIDIIRNMYYKMKVSRKTSYEILFRIIK